MTTNEALTTAAQPDRRMPPGRWLVYCWTRATVFSLVLLCGCASGNREAHPHVVGKIIGNSYTSPHGDFTVPIPVSPEVGGRIVRDDAQSVTFRDNWGSKISFYSRPMSAQSPMTSVVQKQGREKALTTLCNDIYGESIATHYHADILDGTLTFVYLRPVGPKTGVAAIIRQDRVYLVETDLLPGVQLLAKDDDDAQVERDQWLENRAIGLLRTMQIK
jgi:hypothetical protein